MRRRIAALGVLAAASLAPATAYAGVVPTSVDVGVTAGSSTTVAKVVHTPAELKTPDIAFLSDTTGSMVNALGTVQSMATGVVSILSSALPTSQFAVADYKDVPNCPSDPYAYRVDQLLTGDLGLVRSAISGWQAFGGCDDAPEAQLNALYQQGASPLVGAREGASSFVVWFGDASGHDPSLGHSMADVVAALQRATIRVVAVPVDTRLQNTLGTDHADGLDATGQATAVANATSGTVLADATSDRIAQWLLTAMGEPWVQVTPFATCDPGLTATFDPPLTTVVSGMDARFSERLTVAAGASGVLHCTIDFRLGATLVGGMSESVPGFQEFVTVTVTSGAPRTALVTDARSSATGARVSLWRARWSKLGPCGGRFEARAGRRGAPAPSGKRSRYVVVAVARHLRRAGSATTGDATHEVLVKTDGARSGRSLSGTVVARLC